jgi:hypothetical protein
VSPGHWAGVAFVGRPTSKVTSVHHVYAGTPDFLSKLSVEAGRSV